MLGCRVRIASAWTEEGEKPTTLEQVGQIIGVTKERVRQIQNKAMEQIRLQLEANLLGTRDREEAEAQAQGETAAAAG
jgi:DNA-directed RNA polymerase sigma subunit (sigma70/sigma32)